MKMKTKSIISIVLCLILTAAMTVSVFAADLDSLLEQAEGLEDFLNQLTIDMKTLSLEYDYIQTEIDNTETMIASNEVLLGDAETACDEQYDLMKKRIRYIYESGDINYLTALLSSDSISDILNKFEYIDSIVGYDRNMLQKYNDLIDTVETLQSDLVAKKADLEELRTQAMANMLQAAAVDAEAEQKVVEYGVDSEEASEVIQDYIDEYGAQIQAEIEGQIAMAMLEDPEYDWYADLLSNQDYLQEAEILAGLQEGYDWYDPAVYQVVEVETEPVTEYIPEQPAAPVTEQETTTARTASENMYEGTGTIYEALMSQQLSAEEAGINLAEGVDPNSDAYLIACLVSGEAGFTDYETQVHIAQMIYNRMNSEYFPDTAYDVINQPGQFNIWDAEGNEIRTDTYFIENGPMESALQAANEVLASESYDFPYLGCVTEDFYYSNPWYFTDTYGEIIDGGYFFNYTWWPE